MTKRSFSALCATTLLCWSSAMAGPLDRPECIVPAKPGGGFDLTCGLVQAALRQSGAIQEPMRVGYLPGGIGAVAYNTVIAQRPGQGSALERVMNFAP